MRPVDLVFLQGFEPGTLRRAAHTRTTRIFEELTKKLVL